MSGWELRSKPQENYQTALLPLELILEFPPATSDAGGRFELRSELVDLMSKGLGA